jgi:hypothetical protein
MGQDLDNAPMRPVGLAGGGRGGRRREADTREVTIVTT